jgi:hypothetical protein
MTNVSKNATMGQERNMEFNKPFRIKDKEYSPEDLDVMTQPELRGLLSIAKDELYDVETFLDIDDRRDIVKTRKRKSFKRMLEVFIDSIAARMEDYEGDDEDMYHRFYRLAKELLIDELFDDLERAARRK